MQTVSGRLPAHRLQLVCRVNGYKFHSFFQSFRWLTKSFPPVRPTVPAARRRAPCRPTLIFKMATNITAVEHTVKRSERGKLLGVDSKFHGCTVWFTGAPPNPLPSFPFGSPPSDLVFGIPISSLELATICSGTWCVVCSLPCAERTSKRR